MAWITPTTRSTGTLITASIWNQDAVDNPIALRTGALEIAGQLNGRFVVASSSTQLSVAKQSYVMVFTQAFGPRYETIA